MADFLVDNVSNFTTEDVFKNWFPGVVAQGILLESGIFDSSPLKKTIGRFLERGIHESRHITVGATDYDTGELTLWDETMPIEVSGRVLLVAASVCWGHQKTNFQRRPGGRRLACPIGRWRGQKARRVKTDAAHKRAP